MLLLLKKTSQAFQPVILQRSKGFQTNNKYWFSLCVSQACHALSHRALHILNKTETFQKSVMSQMLNIKQYNRWVHKLLSIIIQLSLYYCCFPYHVPFPSCISAFYLDLATILNFVFIIPLFKKIACTSKQYIVLVSFGQGLYKNGIIMEAFFAPVEIAYLRRINLTVQ